MNASDDIGSCVMWTQAVYKDGYGITWHKGRKVGAHRVALCTHLGISIEDIAGLLVRHRCDTPGCVRGDHLLLGTAKDNSGDMVRRKRSCARTRNPSAVLTEDQVAYIREVYIPRHREYGQTALAKRFGVSQPAVGYIVRGEHWK